MDKRLSTDFTWQPQAWPEPEAHPGKNLNCSLQPTRLKFPFANQTWHVDRSWASFGLSIMFEVRAGQLLWKLINPIHVSGSGFCSSSLSLLHALGKKASTYRYPGAAAGGAFGSLTPGPWAPEPRSEPEVSPRRCWEGASRTGPGHSTPKSGRGGLLGITQLII